MASFNSVLPETGAPEAYNRELARLNNEPRPYLPDWFVRDLTEIGGRDTVTNMPNYRIVWGQDREAQKMYVEHGVAVWRPNYIKGYFTQLIRLSIKGQMIAPVIEKSEPVAMPCYFLEKYIPARNITQKLWEGIRWFVNDQGIKEDLMGPFPERGHYVEYLCLKDPETQEIIVPCQAVLDELKERLALAETSGINKLSPRELNERILKAKKAQETQADLSYLFKLRDIRRHYKRGLVGDAQVGVMTNHCQPLIKIAS